jgi:hypothetical protein
MADYNEWDNPVIENKVTDNTKLFENNDKVLSRDRKKEVDGKKSLSKYKDYSRRYFSIEGEEIQNIVVEKLRSVWARIDKSVYEEYCITKSIEFEQFTEKAKYSKDFIIKFERYLNEQKSPIYFVNSIKLEANADENVQTVKITSTNKDYNPDEENEVTYANGSANLEIHFDDAFVLSENFEFSDGPMGNGATPNGKWKAKKHPTYGVKGNPKFSTSIEMPDHSWVSTDMPSFQLYEKNVTKSKPKKPVSNYKNRGSMLIHCTNENTVNYPNAEFPDDQNKAVNAKGGTEGCIGIVGNENSWRYLPFFASFVLVHFEFDVAVNFTNNKNVGYQLYLRDKK